MTNKNLQSAYKYLGLGFSVIPVKRNKRPYVPWEAYQKRKPSRDEIQQWWHKWPDAQVAVVCGEISGVTVVDADSEDSYRNLTENFLPDSVIIPVAKTSKGYHLYFKYVPGVSNAVRFFEDCDLRNDGGYVLAPPSKNEKGEYKWLPGCRITENPPVQMPDFLADTIRNVAPTNNLLNSESLTSYTNSSLDHTRERVTKYAGEKEQNDSVTSVTGRDKRYISFSEPGRDETLFHLANHLVKSGMPENEIRIYLEFIAQNCNPPFNARETETKIQSAFKRNETRSENITNLVRDFVSVTNGDFSVTDALQGVTSVTTSQSRTAVRQALHRMWKAGDIERVTNRDGVYRRIDTDCTPIDLTNLTCDEPVKLHMPLELTDKVIVTHGDIILVSGAQNAGKSAVLMDIAKQNRHKMDVHYFSSEMSASKFIKRISRDPYIDLDNFTKRVKFYERADNFADVIVKGKGNLNIIDYLEMHDQFWLVSKHLANIFNKLDGAIAVVALQKDPKAEYGRGGSFTQEKPVLSLSIDNGKARITKCKEFPDGNENPQGSTFEFKLVQGFDFRRKHMELGWTKE